MAKIFSFTEPLSDNKSEKEPNKIVINFNKDFEVATNYSVTENNNLDRQYAEDSIFEPRALLFSAGKKIVEDHQKSEITALQKTLSDNPHAKKMNSEALLEKLKNIQAVELIYTNATSQINKVAAAQRFMNFCKQTVNLTKGWRWR